MKKSKILTLLVMVVMLIGCFVLTNTSAAVTASSFIAAPEKTLVKGVDYEYSFAVLGDTQCISVADAKKGTSYTEQMFNWIKNNKDEKNIQYVLGLGDITNTFKSSDTYYTAEWQIAKDCYAILDEAGIPYSLVRGNHDISSGMNATFGWGTEYYESIVALAGTTDSEGRAMGGFLGDYTDATMSAYKIENSYRKITAGEDKWLIVTLDWAPSEAALTWLSGILETNPDYRAIITLHQFLQKDGAIIDDPEGTLPHENIGDANWGEVTTGGTVHPRVLWDNVLSKYANVEMIISGHVPVDDIVRTQYRGDNGNTVTCMLIDPQEMDEVLSTPVGMVAMLYFSADGNVVHVEYISAIRDSDGDSSTNAYRGANNQFSMQLEYADGWVKTEYGYVPKADHDSATFLAFLDDDGDPTTDSVYLGSYERWVDDAGTGGLLPMIRTQFTLGGATIRQKKTLSVLTLKDYDGTTDGKYQLIGEVCGTLRLDLNGHTFTNGKYPLIAPYARTNYTTNTFEIVNGNVVISSTGGLCALQTVNDKANGGAITVNVENVNLSYAAGATQTDMIVTTYPGNQSYNSTGTVTLTNCTIDAYNNAPSGVMLFDLKDSYSNQDTKLVINGGKIITSSAASICSLGEGDSFYFGKSGNDYTTLSLPLTESAPTGIYKTGDGKNVSFAESSRNDTLVSYELQPYEVPGGSLGVINVWLIGGQSNASGYAIDTPTDALTDSRFTNGFEDVLYYGSADDNVISTFVPVKIGLGKSSTAIGAEIGIASMVGGNGTMNAVIKLGRGSSYLYPDTSNTVSQNYGTWTSPSYIANNGVNTAGTNIGKLYEDFLRTVTEGLELLEAQGYTPVIRGMWWMQGEAEMWREALALEYENLLTTFIGDIRNDLSTISGENLSNMPFVIGIAESNKIKDENGDYVYNQPSYDKKVAEAQRAVAGKVPGVSYVETEQLLRRDQWHFVADAQQYLGEQFVNHVIFSEGKYSVTVNGASITMTGGGSYEPGTTVTVTLVAEGGFVIQKITYTVNGTSTEITLDENNSYTFTMPEGNVIFKVTSYDPNMVDTVYGSIPSQFADAEKWPFAVFKNGSFYQAYATWNEVLRAGNSILTKETPKATLLLRRDYSTSEDTESLQDLYTFEGELTFDLGNHTLTRGKYHLFQIMAKKTTAKARSTSLKITNGTIQTQGSAPLVINSRDSALADHFYFEFDGVTFSYASGSTSSNMIAVTYTNGSVETEVSATFKNCVFNLIGAPSCTIFGLKEESGASKSAYVTIENSVFVANTLTGVSLFTATGNDTFTLGEGVTFRLPTSFNVSPFTYSDTTGITYALELKETVGDESVYTLKETEVSSDDTAYGEIPAQYSNATTYPFVVFDQNKKFFAAYEKWDTFLSSGSKILTSSNKKAYLLVRRDYDTSENSSSSQNWYTFSGSIEIDLGGNTITIGAKSHLFQLINKCTKDTTTDITITNGSIVTYKNYTPFIINGHTSSTANYTVNLTCNRVNFVYHKSSTLSYLLLDCYTSGTTESNLIATFNSCTFDLSAATKAITLFNAKESSGTVKAATIYINGGNLITSTFNPASNVANLGTGDSVTFGADADGNYLTVTMLGTSKIPAPTTFYTIDGGDAYFHEVESTDEKTVYVLSACAGTNGTHVCSCGNTAGECLDNDKDHLCDVCSEVLSDCADGNNDHLCDVCSKALTAHADENCDHACDICGEITLCTDENKDHACDVCGDKTTCLDEDLNHACDICGEKTPCADGNGDHNCDLCGEKLTDCTDENNDHLCDLCGGIASECKDDNRDHSCDICGEKTSDCKDGDNNHKCDVCAKTLSSCEDNDNDHKCDVCEKRVSFCADKDKNHLCDICGDKTSDCTDKNKDHVCDTCGEKASDCNDETNDHNCDICGKKLTECADGNNDHSCDVCAAKLTDCTDGNGDHLCDACGEVATECTDSDNDHNCDTCGNHLTECADENDDHGCDVCGTKLTECADEDNDHGCDLCGAKLTDCADENGDHLCDLCGNVATYCADENSDHVCDTCGKTLTDCTDENGDRMCDICGKENAKPEEPGDNETTDTPDGDGDKPATDTPKTEEAPKTFIEKIIAFFKDLIEKIKSAFSGKKEQ